MSSKLDVRLGQSAVSASGAESADTADPAGEAGAVPAAVVSRWRSLSCQVAAITSELDRALHEAYGIGMSEFEVLDRLAEVEDVVGPRRMNELAETVHLSQSALSRAVARLERDGLVERTLCDADRRGIFVRLTAAGRARHADALPIQRGVLASHLAVQDDTPHYRHETARNSHSS